MTIAILSALLSCPKIWLDLKQTEIFIYVTICLSFVTICIYYLLLLLLVLPKQHLLNTYYPLEIFHLTISFKPH